MCQKYFTKTRQGYKKYLTLASFLSKKCRFRTKTMIFLPTNVQKRRKMYYILVLLSIFAAACAQMLLKKAAAIQ